MKATPSYVRHLRSNGSKRDGSILLWTHKRRPPVTGELSACLAWSNVELVSAASGSWCLRLNRLHDTCSVASSGTGVMRPETRMGCWASCLCESELPHEESSSSSHSPADHVPGSSVTTPCILPVPLLRLHHSRHVCKFENRLGEAVIRVRKHFKAQQNVHGAQFSG